MVRHMKHFRLRGAGYDFLYIGSMTLKDRIIIKIIDIIPRVLCRNIAFYFDKKWYLQNIEDIKNLERH